jgi:steroid delta-isomerase-like uncharacterized protein
MATSDEHELNARIALVEEHIRCENRHDLTAVMRTFGAEAAYFDEAWTDHRRDRAGVEAYYTDLLRALPDLSITVERRYATRDAVIVEVRIRGHHGGAWRGLPATGRPVDLPLCGVYTFGADGLLASERIYYDRATVLRQLGVFREPTTLAGRLTTLLAHPLTVLGTLLPR